MKNNLKVKIHIFYYLIGIICFFTGYFKYFIICSIFTIIHEMGHISAGVYFSWNIKKIVLLPFGAITIFHEKLNKPIREEMLILILGPLFQILFYFLLNTLFYLPNYVKYIHLFLLGFNLLPIYPLDGSKLLHLFLQMIFSYQKSFKIMIDISYVTVLLLLGYNLLYRNFILFICLIFLTQKVIYHHQLFPYIMNQFLWERYHFSFFFKKRKYISKISDMKRDYIHLFITEKGYITEKKMLGKLFDLT